MMTKSVHLTKAQQREATMTKLIQIARDSFTRDGYANASTEEIVQQAGVTRGALYHHFGSKEGLFQAVLASVQADVGRRVEARSNQTTDIWEQLIGGCIAFLEASLDPQVQRIMLIDAPAVLGWELWRELDAQHSMASLREVLSELMDAGRIVKLPLMALTQLLSGAMNEGALWIAQSDNPHQALQEASETLIYLIQSLQKK